MMQATSSTDRWGMDSGSEMADLDHSLVPFRSRARYLRLVNKISHALDYAAGGFHVSVTRGLCGGAADPALDFAKGGTVAGGCTMPLDRDDLRLAWAKAANAYLAAFIKASSGSAALEDIKATLRVANGLADQAYALEGVDPPRDPVTQETEAPSPGRGLGGYAYAGIGFLGAALLTYAAIKYGGKKKKGRRK